MIRTILSVLRSILAALTGRPYSTGWITVPALVVGSAYTSGDAFGLSFKIMVPAGYGIFWGAKLLDFDNEKLAIDFVIFNDSLDTDTADDAAWVLGVSDAAKFQTAISFAASDYTAAGANAVASIGNLGRPYYAPKGELTVKAVIRGAANLAAASDKPRVEFSII